MKSSWKHKRRLKRRERVEHRRETVARRRYRRWMSAVSKGIQQRFIDYLGQESRLLGILDLREVHA